MKRPNPSPARLLAWLALALFVVLAPGCASTPKPDWNQRVGAYTYDDAVRELGPSTASSQLQDGTRVADWFLKYGSQISFGLGSGAYTGGSSIGVEQTISPPPKAHFLRLTFGPDGKLSRWEKVTR